MPFFFFCYGVLSVNLIPGSTPYWGCANIRVSSVLGTGRIRYLVCSTAPALQRHSVNKIKGASASCLMVNIVEKKPRNNKLDVLEGILAALGGKPVVWTETDKATLARMASADSTVYSSVTILTGIAGAAYTAFPSSECSMLDLVNPSEVAIDYRRDGTGDYITVLAGQSRLIVGITNSDQISIRRTDLEADGISIQAEAYMK